MQGSWASFIFGPIMRMGVINPTTTLMLWATAIISNPHLEMGNNQPHHYINVVSHSYNIKSTPRDGCYQPHHSTLML